VGNNDPHISVLKCPADKNSYGFRSVPISLVGFRHAVSNFQ